MVEPARAWLVVLFAGLALLAYSWWQWDPAAPASAQSRTKLMIAFAGLIIGVYAVVWGLWGRSPGQAGAIAPASSTAPLTTL